MPALSRIYGLTFAEVCDMPHWVRRAYLADLTAEVTADGTTR